MVFKRRDKPPLLRRLREALFPRRGWRRGIEYLGHRLRRIPDTPHRIALGFGIGVFASFTPFFGAHVLLALGLAKVMRGNLIASFAGTLVGNPVTIPFFAAISLALGRRILGHGATGRDFTRVSDAFEQAGRGLWSSILSLFGYGDSQWRLLAPFFKDIFWPYFVGGLLPGLIGEIIFYYIVRPLVAAYQARRRARMLERAHERLVAQAALATAVATEPETGSK